METQKVNIQIPNFKVSINDIEMEKRENKYPIILYRRIVKSNATPMVRDQKVLL
ncbi:hypothetical protein I6I92_11425 [Peptoniphilus asaccharolyticus]|nr:hypothetical protein [Peptoniphilus asaccharolyticus]MBL7576018.1 hypothetical protein [Peptoniphilus asaccharolyticus]MBL7576394.1 hypothetical protein [Peptoniphilus asaccharolyticus]